MSISPLFVRADTDIVAATADLALTTAAVQEDILRLSSALPQRSYAINVCADRLNFLRTMMAVIARGQCNLLPPNKQSETLRSIASKYPDSYLIHDEHVETWPELEDYRVPDPTTAFQENRSANAQHPSTPILIDDDQPAIISFTSGSTGESKPNLKTWSTLRRGNEINAANMLDGAPKHLQMLATVPPQHMYGLELSIMLPWIASVSIYTGQPLYPNDVSAALKQLPEPRALVSTPQHLRVLIASEEQFPPVNRIYSATAPLDTALAKQIEDRFGATLVEIFGCSEIGSFAKRHTATESAWTLFSEMSLSLTEQGAAQISAPHVREPVVLQDVVRPDADGKFTITGRLGDQVNIAGKRGSLAQLNQYLLGIAGVIDGVIFDPREMETSLPSQTTVQRLAGIVVAPTLEKKDVLNALKEHVDPVFLPRPLLFVDSLPRAESSKLPRSALLEFYQSLRDRGRLS